jgi:hypothetical protein
MAATAARSSAEAQLIRSSPPGRARHAAFVEFLFGKLSCRSVD